MTVRLNFVFLQKGIRFDTPESQHGMPSTFYDAEGFTIEIRDELIWITHRPTSITRIVHVSALAHGEPKPAAPLEDFVPVTPRAESPFAKATEILKPSIDQKLGPGMVRVPGSSDPHNYPAKGTKGSR
jgi:hypothetical protein